MSVRYSFVGLAFSAVVLSAALVGMGWSFEIPGLLRFGSIVALGAVILCLFAWYLRWQGWE